MSVVVFHARRLVCANCKQEVGGKLFKLIANLQTSYICDIIALFV